MQQTLYLSSDLVTLSLSTAAVASLAMAALLGLGLSWVGERWRVSVALSAAALLASALIYYQSLTIWQAEGALSAAPRYVGWYVIQPALVAAVFFFARLSGPVSVGVFWRTLAAAILMVFCRFLGDAGIFDPTLGALLSLAFWLYILGELYFGDMSAAVRKASRPIRLAYFWIRLILTIGWAIYPILHFVDVVIGTGHTAGIIVLYTLADLINLITVALIFLSVAGKERY
ncbi:MAG: bacteriorhodopsin [Pseudomonadota bacterium]